MKILRVILGNQLFPISQINLSKDVPIFMAEDNGLCSYIKHHKSKIALFFSAMRSYRDQLKNNSYKVIYYDANNNFSTSYFDKLLDIVKSNKIEKIEIYEIEDKPFERDFLEFCKTNNIEITFLPSPMFIDSRGSFKHFLGDKKFHLQANYYKQMRKKKKLLLEDNKPIGGRWSFDEDNRKKLPSGYEIPKLPIIKPYKEFSEISNVININFSNHPGELHSWMPHSYEQIVEWLEIFFKERFNEFGHYEDAIDKDEHFINHSVLSSSLNLGLITPKEVIDKSIDYAEKNDIPLNSLEGFIRQIIGWREFIRGIYQNYGDQMVKSNYWNHKNKLTAAWYDGSTGIEPLDEAIKGAIKYGYTHHINRLMILSNIMNLCNIDPNEIYKWFMEMFIDSSDWVMVPNVYGMGTFADGGIFATKPYICGSSYILRMSNFKKGDWCDIVDGLYWKFIEEKKDFFITNPRLSLMIRALEKLNPDRKKHIFECANNFINKVTQ
ncbi:MAG: cryptochrome/photolyase family protein [SAR86 cluster bacterium]|nr:MAG: cryptochrome/photolyase family protein [SAR86 cluster bacterium]